jgi:hypothetical protein
MVSGVMEIIAGLVIAIRILNSEGVGDFGDYFR